MLPGNEYSRFIQHLKGWILDLPDSEYLTNLLELTVSTEEAEFLTGFPFLPHTLEQLALKYRIRKDTLRNRLDSLARRSIIFRYEHGSTLEYALNEPYFIFFRGPYWEGRRDTKTRDLAVNANKYFLKGMGREWGQHPTMRLRAIPIQKTIQDTRETLPYEDVAELIQKEDYFCVGNCPCREMKNIDPDETSCTHETFNCLHFGRLGRYMVKQEMGKKISLEETMEILGEAADAGLVHGISNTKNVIDSICNCCSCCCVFMKSAHILGLNGHQSSNYILEINKETCKGCGLCVNRCPMKTITLEASPEANNKTGQVAVLKPEKCLGCGVCVHKCPTQSLRLIHRKDEQDFPHDLHELNERQAQERRKMLMGIHMNNE